MEHSFDINIAQEYGIAEAIILKHLYYWVKRNALNGKNEFDGRYWTYNSIKAYSGLFPYLTEKQIRSILAKLKEKGLILIGNHNEDARDRTLWYTLTDKGMSLFEPKREIAFDQMGKSHLPSRANSFDQMGKCNNKYINNNITDTDIKPNINTDKTRAREEAPALQPIPFTPPAELDRQRRSAETGNPPLKPEEEKIAFEWFGRFWKAYPKKQGQVEARLAWMRMRFDVQLYTEIVEAVQRFRAVRRDWQTAAGRYVPMPANFLMNERWKDEVAAEQPVDFDKPMDIASMAAMIVAEGEKQNADREGYYGRAGNMEGRGAYPAEGGEPGRIPNDDTVDAEPVWSA